MQKELEFTSEPHVDFIVAIEGGFAWLLVLLGIAHVVALFWVVRWHRRRRSSRTR